MKATHYYIFKFDYKYILISYVCHGRFVSNEAIFRRACKYYNEPIDRKKGGQCRQVVDTIMGSFDNVEYRVIQDVHVLDMKNCLD